MKAKKTPKFVLVMFLISIFFQNLSGFTAMAFAQENDVQEVVNENGLKLTTKAIKKDEGIQWQLAYQLDSSQEQASQRLKVKVSSGDSQLSFDSKDGWEINEERWFLQQDFTRSSAGTLTFKTKADQTVSLTVQQDRKIVAEDGTETIERDILSADLADPYLLQKKAQASNGTQSNERAAFEESQTEAEVSSEDSEDVSSDMNSLTNSQTVEIPNKDSVTQKLETLADGQIDLSEFSFLSSAERYLNQAPDYTTNETGIFPTFNWQPEGNSTVRNHQGKKIDANTWDGITQWDGNPSNRTNSYIEYGSDPLNPDFALRKYAKETDTQGLYDVYLNVRGNQHQDIKPIDIVLVVDMSGSMEPGNNSGQSNRAQAARDGVKSFLEAIKSAGISEYVNVGFVGYSSPGYISSTGVISEEMGSVSNSAHVSTINSQLNQTFRGGTFTQLGIRTGAEMLNNDTSGNAKMMILITDGVPTFSYKVTSAINEAGTIYGTQFNSSRRDEPGNTAKLSIPYTIGSWQDRLTITDTWAATLGEAKNVKADGIELHALGIQLTADGNYMTDDQVRSKMSLIASPTMYQDANSADAVKEYLLTQAKNVISSFNTISNGSISDPIGQQFSYNSGSVDIRSVGSTGIAELPTAAINNGQLTVSQLNLGENQELQLHYQVRINTENTDFIPDTWYQMNERTTLTPNGNAPEAKVDFGVPSAKAAGTSLNLKKIWQEYDNQTVSRPDYLDFLLSRNATTMTQAWTTGFIRLSSQNWAQKNITQVSAEQGGPLTLYLPKFNNQGQDFIYKIETELNLPEEYKAASNEDGSVWTNTKIYQPLELEINKVSDQGQQPLTGAVFKLTGSTLSEEGVLLKDYGDGSYRLFDEANKLQLDSVYTLTEISPPEGYSAKETSWTIKVSKTGQVTINDRTSGFELLDNTIHYTIENQFVNVPIGIEKYGIETHEKLAGAKFTLTQYDENWTGSGSIIGRMNDLIANDKDSLKWLTPGYYTLKETTTPNGYIEDGTAVNFQLDDHGRLLDAHGAEIKAGTVPKQDGWYVTESAGNKKYVFAKYNQLRPFELAIFKQDVQTKKALANTTFELYSEEGTKKLAVLTTAENGEGQFMQADVPTQLYLLSPGKFQIKEKQAPDGYVLLSGTFDLVLDNEGKAVISYEGDTMASDTVQVTLNTKGSNTIGLTIANTPKGQLTATGGQGRTIFWVGAFASLLLAIMVGGCSLFRNRKELK